MGCATRGWRYLGVAATKYLHDHEWVTQYRAGPGARFSSALLVIFFLEFAMAEPGLTLTWTELKQAVGFYLGFGTTVANWTTAQATEIELIVQSGYRRVLYPPAVIPDAVGYDWSFLRPTTTLSIVADDGDYDLPDDYGRIIGLFHYAADEHRAPIVIVSESHILQARSSSDRNGYPDIAAIRYKASDRTAGQKQEVLFYPEPDASKTLTYSFDAYTGKLSDAAPYPLGTMVMSEVYKESCLAVAEERNNDELGLHHQLFTASLADAIARDRKHGAKNYGQMGQPAEAGEEVFRRGNLRYSGAYDMTYKGNQI